MSADKLKELLQLLEVQDIKEGTPLWEFKLIEGKVSLCREQLGHPACEYCPQNDDCDLVRDYRIQLIYGSH